MARTLVHTGSAVLVALLVSSAYAQRVPVVSGTASIGAGAGVGTTGAVAVNETAGVDNAQANQLTITGGNAVAADNASAQSASVAAKVTSTTASIGSNAFSNSSGALMINQSAGAGNLQRNSVQLGTAAPGVETVSDRELSATAAKNGGQGLAIGVHSVREATISNDAFKNVNGIVQINQTAGAGNATANSFVLRPPAGTLF
ncbi:MULTISPECIES: hypothetical protein [Paraburkholderia]|nr:MULTISPECIES: hypothetical protein [Paraburkholderia]MCX4160757.1 hypothetical protein [Paraburkholderia megapolitana]MDN7156254.1 hypothetical protein [Paraburkholderia sp. CHISQ3]MDQ6493299.1 hypothetical protein [Paraburkholderia megapolitana]